MAPDTSVPSTRHADPRRGRRSWWPVVTLPVIVIVIAAVAVSWATAGAVDEMETIRPTAVVAAVDIDLTAGTVSLAPGEQLVIDVERRSGRFAGTPAVTSAVIDGVLQVTGTCPTLGIGHCATNVTVTVPPTAAINVETGAGSIDGVLTHGPVRASTAAGSIALTITEDVADVSVATGAGSIDLIVPDVTYDVTADTGLGRTRIDVDTSTDAPGTIEARSEVGSVTIRTDAGTPDTSTASTHPAGPADTPIADRAEVATPASSKLAAPGPSRGSSTKP